jgi:hypothetical protein
MRKRKQEVVEDEEPEAAEEEQDKVFNPIDRLTVRM